MESLLPVQGLNSHPLEGEVLTTGPTGKYLKLSTFKETRSSKLYYLLVFHESREIKRDFGHFIASENH